MSIADGVRPHSLVMNSAHDIGIVSTLDAFEALRAEWDALFDSAALPRQLFQSHSFLSHWARHYLDPSMTLHIITGRQHGRLVMIWPLVRRRRFGLTLLQFMGSPVAQFGDILLDPTSDVQALAQAGWAAVERSGADLFFAQKVREDSTFFRLCGGHRPAVIESQQAPFADLAVRVCSSGPGSAYSPRDRSAYRRRLKRLAEGGDLAFGAFMPGPEAAVLARQAIAFKLDQLKRHAILSPTLSDPRFSLFFADCAADPASSLRVSTLERAGRPIGIDLSFDCQGKSFGHVIAADPDCEREGVGGLLIHHVFAAAAQRGATAFDMMAPADPYKLRHADGQTAIQDQAFAFTLRGRLYCEAVLRYARPLAKALARKLPTGLVQRFVETAR
ncbi:GNAT family N-acetyltransferase [Mesorhizobium yinganensis]|uniref:GNAT family N-acetyltransferase n=1 Tax=Mesorhizobium yinganensis TaxID=3157707 RepID=UPI0032B7D2FB